MLPGGAEGLRAELYDARGRQVLRQQLAAAIESKTGKPDVIAGVATGAIAHGVLAAQALDLPFIYVRPKPKEHGLGNQIEGEVEAGKRAVVVEDLVSTGMSSLQALQALRSAGVEVKGMVAIFDYGFQVAKKAFNEAKCDLFTLSDYPTLIRVAMETNYIKEADLKALTAWRNHPDTWQQPKS